MNTPTPSAGWRSILKGGRVKFATGVYQSAELVAHRLAQKHRTKVLVKPYGEGPNQVMVCTADELGFNETYPVLCIATLEGPAQ